MAISIITHTDASAPVAIGLDSGGFAVWSVALDSDHTLTCIFNDGDTFSDRSDDTYSFVVLYHPIEGGGSWGTIVSMPVEAEVPASAVRLDASTVAVITNYELDTPVASLHIRILTISGTTVTIGSRQEIKANDELFDATADYVVFNDQGLVRLSDSRLFTIVEGSNSGKWYCVINLSGTTISSIHWQLQRGTTNLFDSDTEGGEGGTVGNWESNHASILIANSTAQAFVGTHSIHCDCNVSLAGSQFRHQQGTNGVPVDPLTRYGVGFMLLSPSGTGEPSSNPSMIMDYYDSGGVLLSSDNVITNEDLRIIPDGWKAKYGITDSPANAAFASFRFTWSASFVEFYVDDAWLWEAPHDIGGGHNVAIVAIDSSRVLAAYSGDDEELVVEMLEIDSASVTMVQRTVAQSFPGELGPVNNNPHGFQYHVRSGRWMLAANCDDGANLHWRIFWIDITSGGFSVTEDAASPLAPLTDQGNWSFMLDDQFFVGFGLRSSSGSQNEAREIESIYEISPTGVLIDDELVPSDIDLGVMFVNFGQPTFRRRFAVVGPFKWDGVNGITQDTIHGKEIELVNLPCIAPRLVAVGQDNDDVYSDNGIDWFDDALESIGSTLSWRTIMWTGTEFRAAGFFGDYASSPDGLAWTNLEPSTSGDWGETVNVLIYIRELSLWIAGGEGGEHIKTSSDGLAWTLRNSSTAFLRGLAWSPFEGIIVAAATSNQLRTSTDGITWTSRTSGFAVGTNINDALWIADLGIFLIVGANGAYATSSDGITWVASTITYFGTDDIWTAIYSPILNLIVIAGQGGKIMTSPDGSTWTARTSPFGSIIIAGGCWSPGLSLFAIVDGDDGDVATSYDGITWAIRSTSMPDGLNSIVEGLIPCPETGEWVLGFSAID